MNVLLGKGNESERQNMYDSTTIQPVAMYVLLGKGDESERQSMYGSVCMGDSMSCNYSSVCN